MIKNLLGGLFGASPAATNAADKWSVGTAEDNDNGRPLIIRRRSGIPSGVTPSAYPHMIGITWAFVSHSGMPSKEESEQMKLLEDSITNTVEPAKQAFLMTIVTGNEVREWQFYTRDKAEFMALLNKALSGKPVFPIQLSSQDDSQWAAYLQFGSPST